MSTRIYAITTSIIFLIVAVFHAVRLFQHSEVIFDGWHFPMWASVVALVVAGFLSFEGFRLFRQARWFSLFR